MLEKGKLQVPFIEALISLSCKLVILKISRALKSWSCCPKHSVSAWEGLKATSIALLHVWFSCITPFNPANLLMKITGVLVRAYAKIHMPLWRRRFKSCKLWLSSISAVRCIISLTHIHAGFIGWRWTVLPHIWSSKQVLREAVISRSSSF